MAQKKLNMKMLFGEDQESPDIVHNKIFHKAALLYNFDIEEHFGDLKKDDIELLKKHSFKRAKDGMRRLFKEDRLNILEKGIKIENLERTIEEYEIESIFTNLIKRLVRNENISVNSLSIVELYYAIVLSNIFPDKFSNEEFKKSYSKRQFFRPFENITKYFAGREKELNQINDYVDWLPKSSFLGSIGAELRSIINFHEKPPLFIQGIGGIGKSTLVSKFILDNNNEKEGKSLPFVYIDFDIPGFSIKEPLSILIEALRQIAIQYPKHENLTLKLRKEISSMIGNPQKNELARNKSTRSSRYEVFRSIKNIISNSNINLDVISKSPVLIVFDSFEEMQYRATDDELQSFMSFVEEISQQIPRVRPIFVGRAEIGQNLQRYKFEKIVITNFDEKSAQALLANWKIDDEKIRDFIYRNFGGNPLMLRLSADLAKKGDFKNLDSLKVEGKKWEYLVDRILGHIHDERVRKIAVPGMLIRTVTPEVIKVVLAEPTGLIYLNDEEAKNIFKELKNEVALISNSYDSDVISFRQDLRMVCEDAIWEKYPKQSRQVRDNAIEYYKNYDQKEDIRLRNLFQAEYFFHLLKDEKIPKTLNSSTYDRLHPYLEQSIIELPSFSRRYINSLNQKHIDQTIIEDISSEEWELNHSELIKSALQGELSSLKQIYSNLKKRRYRLNQGFTEFGKWEALLLQRLNKLNDSNNLISRALEYWQKIELNNKLAFELVLIKAQNHEYQKEYDKAFKSIAGIRNFKGEVSELARKKYEYIEFRIRARNTPYFENPFFVRNLKTNETALENQFIETPWAFIFDKINVDNIDILKSNRFSQIIRKIRKRYSDLNNLEKLTYNVMDRFLKDITYAGEHTILIHDLVYAAESKGKISKII